MVELAVLLAKSSRTPESPRRAETLVGHLADVADVAVAMLELRGPAWLAAAGLDSGWLDVFRGALLRAALLHDLGKANDGFQRMVRSPVGERQAFRHELVSVELVARDDALAAWLGDGLPLRLALCAIAGHHLRFERGKRLSACGEAPASSLRILGGHRDVALALRQTGERLRLGAPPPVCADVSIDLLDLEARLASTGSWLRSAQRWWQSEASCEERALTALVKAALVAADVAGSAVARRLEPASWARRELVVALELEEISAVVQARLAGSRPRPFQERTAALAPATLGLVRAGCGSGKTLAAYLWAARHAVGKRLFVCYPTTGTATEGFLDYAAGEELDALLLHSRADVDLEDVLPSPDGDLDDAQLRFQGLEAWTAPLVVCTADVVLGLMQNQRRALYSFPVIADGAFVFDEVHAYDERLFGSLLRFVEAWPAVPVLCMTASLPRAYEKALERAAAASGRSFVLVPGPADYEALPRYRLRRGERSEALAAVEEALAAGRKVLWVANTVGRAVADGREAERRGWPVLPYHSRYRYADRVQRHRTVVGCFRQPGPALAVTTQVCELSLDLSADLLVTETAPVPSLIQRLGRLNRRASPEQPRPPGLALVVEPANARPYEADELRLTERWLDALGERPISQGELAAAWQGIDDATTRERLESAWLDSGPLTWQAPLREERATTTFVRTEDLDGPRATSEAAIRAAIPMLLQPVLGQLRRWPRLHGHFVAPAGWIDYSPRWGASWRA
jgi:CRISPR-associated endonuclease/helicase Cas3